MMRAPAFMTLVVLAACATPPRMGGDTKTEPTAKITPASLLGHIKMLSSDLFEGRAPGTVGEGRTVDYIQAEMKNAGLAPGNPDGGWTQSVPMLALSSRAEMAFDRQPALRSGEDFVAWSYSETPNPQLASRELVFVGYGMNAPEKSWADYKDVDVKGKTVVVLAGDPLGGPMTIHGRWTRKFEVAHQAGAAAALIIHETGPAGYGWNVVAAGASHERYEIHSDAALNGHLGAEGWIHENTARKLIPNLDELMAAARKPGFRAVPLPNRVSIAVQTKKREVMSQNVIGRVVGTDLKDEHVVYSAHWDHFGKNEKGVFHGALDNAAGIAWLLETAAAFTLLHGPPRRSLLFMATTAEESGLIGAKYYASHPLYPIDKTVANINLDIPNPWGRTKSIVSLGLGQTTMDATLAEEAAEQGRRVVPDPEGEKGYYFRSDHFEFAKRGVPALGFLFPGADYVDQPPDFGKLKREDYIAHRYHSPNDVIAADWDLRGMVEDTALLFRVGQRIANDDATPQWSPGAAFRR